MPIQPAQTQLYPYLRSVALIQDLIPGAPVRFPLNDRPIDMTVEDVRNGVIKFREDDRMILFGKSITKVHFPLREKGTQILTEPVPVRELAAGDELSYMGEDTKVHAISRRPGELIARVSIYSQKHRKRAVAYCDIRELATRERLLNGDFDPWTLPIETANNYEPAPLLVHPRGGGYWAKNAPIVQGAKPTPRSTAGWEQLTFTGQFWTQRHPSDPAKRPRAWSL